VKIPTLTKLSESAARTVWRADFASAAAGQATTYRVETYPNSSLVFVTSWVRDRKVTGARVHEAIRLGLKHAESAQ